MQKYDFCGWATKNDIKCTDGRVIRRDAFKHCDGQRVPLVWNHQHNAPEDVLGWAELHNQPEGVYTYGSFNETEGGQQAKALVEHGDITGLSIYANQLQQAGCDVIHGTIREVSLVLAGANKGARIEAVLEHADNDYAEYDDAQIFSGENIELYHAEETTEKKEDTTVAKENGDKTIKDVIDTMNEEQKNALYAVVAAALNDEGDDNNDEEDSADMKHNVFEGDTPENTMTHSEMKVMFDDMRRYGSLKDSVAAHSAEYGIEQIDWLFPEPKTQSATPEFIKRETGWVPKVMNGVHHTPFSRIKSMFADITEDDARAKGYMKGNLKKDEVFTLLKRTTTPTTIYKKQKMDRDDVIDITDFEVVSWLKSEMRMMLDEEIARAILVGDGRNSSSDDKINEQNIRPIVSDAELYTIRKKVTVKTSATDAEKAKALIRASVKSRKDYRGSGEPTLFTTEDWLTEMLLLEDTTGRIIYDTTEKLKSALRVKEIVTVPVMEGVKGVGGGDLMGIIVNLADYNIGADKGGAINMFEDFDIDYNQQKYLIETRCSGALTKPYSAIALELDATASA
nr:MAG TPA: major capsid protein [Caudoviricetes sp.]